MELSGKAESFVLHFGEMGSRWGFNRTVGQILALIVIQPQPLHAEQIASALSISRGNVSMGLKELQSWRLVQRQHQAGDRKEYYSHNGSFWDMAKTVFEERRKREIDPTLSMLRDNLLVPPVNDDEVYAQQQLTELHDLLELLTQWAEQLNTLSIDQLQSLMKLGSGVSKILELKDRVVKKQAD